MNDMKTTSGTSGPDENKGAKEKDEKKLSVGTRKTLSLGRSIETSTVRQSFSHGRSKAVVVEKKKRRAPVASLPLSEGRSPREEGSTSETVPPKQREEQARRGAGSSPSAFARGGGQTALRQGSLRKGVGGGGDFSSRKKPGARNGGGAGRVGGLTESESAARALALKEALLRQKAEAEREQLLEKQKLLAEHAKEEKAAQIDTPIQLGEETKEKVPSPSGKEEVTERKEKEEETVAQFVPTASISESSDLEKRKAKREREGRRISLSSLSEIVGRKAGLGGDKSQEKRATSSTPKKLIERRFGFGPTSEEKGKSLPTQHTEEKKVRGQHQEPAQVSRKMATEGSFEGAAASARKRNTTKEEGSEFLRPLKLRDEDRSTGGGGGRRPLKASLVSLMDEDKEERGISFAALRRRRDRRAREKKGLEVVAREKIAREVVIPEVITVQDLANRMAERAVDVIKLLMKQGQMVKINDLIDADTAQLIAEELGHTVKRVSEADVEDILVAVADKEEDKRPCPPIVTIMGHVDHGKTSLLDAFRESSVVSGEAGGITQHIGAYQVTRSGQKITFIDTPGHAAFSEMRARGAKVTDIVILVVAADDGVKPQTREAIAHARAAHVPLIVAINKIDKPGADPDRVRKELLQEGILVESLGGDVLEVEVSAKERRNLSALLDAILLQAEILELKANPNCAGEGVVLEARLDKGRGPVITALIQKGLLKIGDIIIAGQSWGRVRALLDDHGQAVPSAEVSKPVEVLGLQSVPQAGDRFVTVENEGQAREITQYRQRRLRETTHIGVARSSLEQMITRLKTNELKELPLLIKGDVQGSVEAVVSALTELGTKEVAVRIIYAGVGGISESDMSLARASGALVIGFNVRANKQAREVAEREGIEIRYYNIIYTLIDEIKAALSGMLSPEVRETFLGNAEVLEIFDISKVGKIAGCRVTEGSVRRGARVRLIRDNVVIHEGQLGTLKRFKDDVKEVSVGQECGMNFVSYHDMRPGDTIECFTVEEIARSL